MKNLMVCTVAALLLFSANIVSAQEKNFIDTPYIEVTGKAEMEVVPDEIYVGITINEKDNKGKVSVDQQEQEMFKQLKEIGIDVEKEGRHPHFKIVSVESQQRHTARQGIPSVASCRHLGRTDRTDRHIQY